MEEHAVTHWIYLIAALLLGSSLLFTAGSGRCSWRAISLKVLPFIPVVILIYSLFMVSQMF